MGKAENAGTFYSFSENVSSKLNVSFIITATLKLLSADAWKLQNPYLCQVVKGYKLLTLKPFPDDKILDWSKLKAFADYKLQ